MKTLYSFKQFLEGLVLEELHPELQDIAASSNTTGDLDKKTRIAHKIRELSMRGEKTGIEGNMPEGSSRAYLSHSDDHHLTIDGEHATMRTGTKVAIKSELDQHYKKSKAYSGMSLGQMQNKAENGTSAHDKYRTLNKLSDGTYSSNHNGIFPPLLSHDNENHEWSHIGHANDIDENDFRHLTKSSSHPEGLSHNDFYNALERKYDRDRGKYHPGSSSFEHHMESVSKHPIVKTFMKHQDETGMSPSDLVLENLGRWKHPVTGRNHLVARDAGWNDDVSRAYNRARHQMFYG